MGTMIGSARMDERGKISGGKAGDQTGKEVSAQTWYRHAKGWNALRPKDREVGRKIAAAMRAACANPGIGYDQYQRNTLYSAAKAVGFDPSRVTVKCETDCSALVRVCCAFAGILTGDYNTSNMLGVLTKTGRFDRLTAKAYADSGDYLREGDILVTRTKGHTVVALTDGSKYEDEDEDEQSTPPAGQGAGKNPYDEPPKGTVQRKGSNGEAVRWAQWELQKAGYGLPKYGMDGDFGDETKKAVLLFQKARGLLVDGEVGNQTRAAMKAGAAPVFPAKPEP